MFSFKVYIEQIRTLSRRCTCPKSKGEKTSQEFEMKRSEVSTFNEFARQVGIARFSGSK